MEGKFKYRYMAVVDLSRELNMALEKLDELKYEMNLQETFEIIDKNKDWFVEKQKELDVYSKNIIEFLKD